MMTGAWQLMNDDEDDADELHSQEVSLSTLINPLVEPPRVLAGPVDGRHELGRGEQARGDAAPDPVGEVPVWADQFARSVLNDLEANRQVNLNSYCLLNLSPRVGARPKISFTLLNNK